MSGKKCQICNENSGMYPLCKKHLLMKKEGLVFKNEVTGIWELKENKTINNKNVPWISDNIVDTKSVPWLSNVATKDNDITKDLNIKLKKKKPINDKVLIEDKSIYINETYDALKNEYINLGIKVEIAMLLCEFLPINIVELETIYGVGPKFIEKYNKDNELINLTKKFIKENNIKVMNLDASKLYHKELKDLLTMDIMESDDTSFNKYATFLNEYFSNILEMNLNGKHICNYFIKIGYITFDDQGYHITDIGYKNNFKINIRSSNVIDIDSNIHKIINKELFNIYCDVYNKCTKEVNDKINEDVHMIFDLDDTIFSTRKFREKQRNEITDAELKTVSVMQWFIDFTNEIKIKLPSTKFIILSNSPENYCRKLLDLHNIIVDEVIASASNCKKTKILEYKNKCNFNSIFFAFGDDEKDAWSYENADIKYSLIRKNTNIIFENYTIPSNTNFRKIFEHDYISCKKKNFKSEYFDDVLVYYRRYYEKYDKYINEVNPKMLNPITCDFGKDKIGLAESTAKNVSDDYLNLEINEDVLFVKVPNSTPDIFNKNNCLCDYLFDLFEEKYGEDKISKYALRRTMPVDKAHITNDRSAEKHINTISVSFPKTIENKVIYLFDDIVTSGVSMMVCADLLYKAGASHVVCFAVARTWWDGGFKKLN